MSEALRAVFAEFGFDIDLPTLEKLDGRLRDAIKTTEKSTKANDDHFAKLKKAAKEEREALTAKLAYESSAEGKEQAAWKRRMERQIEAEREASTLGDSLSSWGGILELVDKKVASIVGENLMSRFKGLDAMAKRLGVTSAGVGRVVIGASLAIVGALHRGISAAFDFANAFAADSEALRDTAREMRMTTTELQELDHAAAQSGVGVERMRSGVQKFANDLRDAERWGNATTGLLRRLGIQARGTDGHIRPTADVLNDVSLALERIPNPTRRARVAVQLFGESGRRMLDVLHSGPGGLMALRDELADLGGGVTPEATEASRKYTQATERLKVAQDSLRSVLATTLLPALTWVVQRVTEAEAYFARITRGTHVMEIALGALGVVGVAVAAALLIAWAPVIAPIVAATAAVIALVLIFDDLVTFIQGGDSALGRFLDSMAGVGTSAQYAHELREEWEGIVEALSQAMDLLAPVLTLMAKEDAAEGRLQREARRVVSRDPIRRGSAPPLVNTNVSQARTNHLLGIDSPNYTNVPTIGDDGRLVPVPASAVPPTRTVGAPGGVTNQTTVRQISRQATYHFAVSGPDANVVTNQVMQRIRAAEQAQRDADHPQEDDG